jgi:hypothetical protein
MTERTTDEAIAEIWKLFADTDARMKETDALLKETAASMKDTDARMKETDARIRRMEGAWGIQWGRMLEALVRPAAIALFRARGIDVHYTFRNLENTVNGQRMELDVVLENDRDTVVIEVKSMVRARDVDDFLDELNALLEFFTRYAGRRVYAGIAGLDFAEGADRYAYHKGLFVLGLTGEGLVTIRNDLKFRPRDFGAGTADLAA